MRRKLDYSLPSSTRAPTSRAVRAARRARLARLAALAAGLRVALTLVRSLSRGRAIKPDAAKTQAAAIVR